MESKVNSGVEQQMQNKISRIAEGILMLGGALIGLWLLAVIAMSFMK
jgi:tetrahydromethanopterin S-methyltransferase subunit G